MKLRVSGQLSFYMPGRVTEIEVPLDQPARLQDVLSGLGIPADEVYITALNGEVVDVREVIVRDEDEVRLFPPVSGG
ncbi:MAG: MoaD/ThiS family protein [Chloroflexi bacterium]|jgi:sulfur carrier protein ThiS|nr:MoaD/ThiS family protein [Chloroflexota bacterium]